MVSRTSSWGSRLGMSVTFSEEDVRPIGRISCAVSKGIELTKEDVVIDMDVAHKDAYVLAISSKGYGKPEGQRLSSAKERGGTGIKGDSTAPRRLDIWYRLKIVSADDQVLVITTTQVSSFERMRATISGTKPNHDKGSKVDQLARSG